MQIDRVALRPIGQEHGRDTGGKIEFANDQVALTGVSMVVVDPDTGGRSELSVAGG